MSRLLRSRKGKKLTVDVESDVIYSAYCETIWSSPAAVRLRRGQCGACTVLVDGVPPGLAHSVGASEQTSNTSKDGSDDVCTRCKMHF